MITPSAEARGGFMRTTDEDRHFTLGIAHFNEGEFFKAHEVWEELWLHAPLTEKAFLQGLIQVAAAFHHHRKGNLRGTKSLIAAGVAKIANYPGDRRGIDVARLLRETEAWLDGEFGQPPRIHGVE